MMMVPYTHSKKLNFGNATHQEKETRMQEIIDSIQNTLNHELTGYVYIFYQDPLLIPYIQKQNLKHKENIIFVPNIVDTISMVFRYANEHLINKTVLIMNADTYPLEGFDQVNTSLLRENKLVYLISRYISTCDINCNLVCPSIDEPLSAFETQS